jgi:hypothetical protein
MILDIVIGGLILYVIICLHKKYGIWIFKEVAKEVGIAVLFFGFMLISFAAYFIYKSQNP